MTNHVYSHESPDWDRLCQSLNSSGVVAIRHGQLGARTTYRVGGNAAVVAEVASARDLVIVASHISSFGVADIVIVGNGSNMLVADSGYNGIAIVLNATGRDDIVVHADGSIDVSGHVSLPQLARQTVAAKRCGLEWAVGVPGTVGGGVRMNAGGHGSDMAASVISARIFDVSCGSCADVSVSDLGLRFRASALLDTHVVVSAHCATSEPRLHNGHNCQDELSEIVRWRRENQPGGQNAGSVFVNPGSGDLSAGALIDSAGLRGVRHGSAVVTEKHANFIQADPSGSADDVVALMCEVQDAVQNRHNISMRSEIRLIGFPPEITERFIGTEHHDQTWVAAASKLDAIVRSGDLTL